MNKDVQNLRPKLNRIIVLKFDLLIYNIGALYNEYGPPPGFCWDLPCYSEPIIDGEGTFDNNMEGLADSFYQFVIEQSESYLTNHILVTMGEDFQYQAAHTWFINIDKLIAHFNKNQEKYKLNVFYSTPGKL